MGTPTNSPTVRPTIGDYKPGFVKFRRLVSWWRPPELTLIGRPSKSLQWALVRKGVLYQSQWMWGSWDDLVFSFAKEATWLHPPLSIQTMSSLLPYLWLTPVFFVVRLFSSGCESFQVFIMGYYKFAFMTSVFWQIMWWQYMYWNNYSKNKYALSVNSFP